MAVNRVAITNRRDFIGSQHNDKERNDTDLFIMLQLAGVNN